MVCWAVVAGFVVGAGVAFCVVVAAGLVAGAGVAFGAGVGAAGCTGVFFISGFGAGAGVCAGAAGCTGVFFTSGAFCSGAGEAAFDHSVVLPFCARPVLSEGRKKNIPAPRMIRTKIPTERIVHKSFCCSILFPFLKYFYYFLSSFFTAAYITYSKNIGI